MMRKEDRPSESRTTGKAPTMADRLFEAAKNLPPITAEEFRKMWDEKIWPGYLEATRKADKGGGWKSDQQRPTPPEILHRKTDL